MFGNRRRRSSQRLAWVRPLALQTKNVNRVGPEHYPRTTVRFAGRDWSAQFGASVRGVKLQYPFDIGANAGTAFPSFATL